MRLILGEESQRCQINKDIVEQHFRRVSSRKPCNLDLYNSDEEQPIDRHSISTKRITRQEVRFRLKRCENTSPGDDRLTYNHWRSVDPACTVIAAIFNICLKYERIPEDWKTSTTVLIYKKGDPEEVTNWRPIAILRTIYKLYTGVLAKRTTQWLINNKVLSPAQKGFLPFDGVFEHNYTLQRKLDKARTEKGEFLASWIDFSNAFGSIPHDAIFASLRQSGAGEKFTNVIKDIYTHSSTRVLTEQGPTDSIDLQARIKQGCPISGLLFNIAIYHILKKIQGQEVDHKVLFYANDLVPMTEVPYTNFKTT